VNLGASANVEPPLSTFVAYIIITTRVGTRDYINRVYTLVAIRDKFTLRYKRIGVICNGIEIYYRDVTLVFQFGIYPIRRRKSSCLSKDRLQ